MTSLLPHHHAIIILTFDIILIDAHQTIQSHGLWVPPSPARQNIHKEQQRL